jgi:hypothetical protein
VVSTNPNSINKKKCHTPTLIKGTNIRYGMMMMMMMMIGAIEREGPGNNLVSVHVSVSNRRAKATGLYGPMVSYACSRTFGSPSEKPSRKA